MPPHPNVVLHDVLTHGDMTSIAALTDVSPQFVSSYCTSEGPASPYAKFIAWLHPVNAVNHPAAQKIVEDVQLRLQEWQGAKERSVTGETQAGSLGDLCGGVGKETAELTCARLRQLPRHCQREEALDVIEAARAFIRGLDAESGEFQKSEISGQKSAAVSDLSLARADKERSG